MFNASFLCILLFLTCVLILHVSVARAPEVFISNGHFSWRELEESTGEDGEVFSTPGELANIDFCAEKVSNLPYWILPNWNI